MLALDLDHQAWTICGRWSTSTDVQWPLGLKTRSNIKKKSVVVWHHIENHWKMRPNQHLCWAFITCIYCFFNGFDVTTWQTLSASHCPRRLPEKQRFRKPLLTEVYSNTHDAMCFGPNMRYKSWTPERRTEIPEQGHYVIVQKMGCHRSGIRPNLRPTLGYSIGSVGHWTCRASQKPVLIPLQYPKRSTPQAQTRAKDRDNKDTLLQILSMHLRLERLDKTTGCLKLLNLPSVVTSPSKWTRIWRKNGVPSRKWIETTCAQ